MPEKPSVDDSFQELSNTANKTDGSLTSGLPLVLTLFKNGSDVGFLPFHWHPSSVPAMIEDEQKGSFCSHPKVLQHFVGYSICARSFFSFSFFRASSSSRRVTFSVMWGTLSTPTVFRRSLVSLTLVGERSTSLSAW